MIRLPTRSPRLTHSFPPRRSSDLEQELSKRLSIQRNRLRCVPGTSERNRLCQRLNLGEQGRLANRRPQIARQAMHQTTFDEQGVTLPIRWMYSDPKLATQVRHRGLSATDPSRSRLHRSAVYRLVHRAPPDSIPPPENG